MIEMTGVTGWLGDDPSDTQWIVGFIIFHMSCSWAGLNWSVLPQMNHLTSKDSASHFQGRLVLFIQEEVGCICAVKIQDVGPSIHYGSCAIDLTNIASLAWFNFHDLSFFTYRSKETSQSPGVWVTGLGYNWLHGNFSQSGQYCSMLANNIKTQQN